MPQHDDTVALQHILDYARLARRIVAGRTRHDLDADDVLRLALTRAVEVIGEAAGRVSQAGRKTYPNVPWQQIVGARNRLIHGYDDINLDILWDIVELDVPSLILALEAT